MKDCFKCHRSLPLSEFYRHPQMGDGHLGKCKDCTKADTHAARLAKLEHYRAYDRERAKLPHRKANMLRVTGRWRKADKRRGRAHNAARRHHRKAPDACQMCGRSSRLERHHPDYDLPLLIVWLCKPCHVIADRQRKDRK